MGSINPFCSATGMNSDGGTSPRSGWFQRMSASTETTARVRSETTGW